MELKFDVVFVGAGPASLSGALYLKRLVSTRSNLKDVKIAVIEKALHLGDHTLSGASLDPKALIELIPDYENEAFKIGSKVSSESFTYLTKGFAFPSPIVPPMIKDKGCYSISLAEFVRWLAGICEREGVEIYTGEAADDLIINGESVGGVIVKEKGVDKEGKQKRNYLDATGVEAKVTVLGEGSRGHLTKRLTSRFNLNAGRTPQGHAVGVKELWEIDESRFKAGRSIHTMGYPLGFKNFGGGFIYHTKDKCVGLGLVVGLDYKDPGLHPFELMQRWKQHPYITELLKGGRLISYGAKTISEGGWYSVPKLYGNGFLLIGECAGLLNSMRIKGIHLAMKSGMLAAETIFDALQKNNFSTETLSSYETGINESWIKTELWKARNFHQGYHDGVIGGAIHTGFQIISGGRGLKDRIEVKEDAECMRKLFLAKGRPVGYQPDGRVSFDKLTCVFASGTKHEEDQPCHLKIDDISICNGICKEEYGNPCQFFCPAHVYEMVENEKGERVLELSPTNCLHCKTCDIKDPYKIVNWTAPEGGGGPNYKGM